MFEGKFGEKIDTPESRKDKLDLEDEILEKTGKEFKEDEKGE